MQGADADNLVVFYIHTGRGGVVAKSTETGTFDDSLFVRFRLLFLCHVISFLLFSFWFGLISNAIEFIRSLS
jgi:hypothetical protein